MSPGTKKVRPDRTNTDESLRSERAVSDLAAAEGHVGAEAVADQVLERAREQADAVLDVAREKADLELDAGAASVGERTAVAVERAHQDAVVEEDRSAADELLLRERAELAQTLARLRPLERQRTDRNLLTERARSDDKIENRDDFLGMVSHDLRNLLCGLVLEATLVEEEAAQVTGGLETVAAMRRLQRYAARMSGLIGDLVDVVSIDAGKFAVRSRPADTAALLAEVLLSFAAAAAEGDVVLSSDIAGLDVPASFDHDRMLQVLANLIGNALKFTPRGGRISVRAERLGSELCISVRDSGVGIPAHQLEAVFRRFWQVGKEDRRGLGLGLYISKCIVDAHGGRIWAESELGVGSTFFLALPDAP